MCSLFICRSRQPFSAVLPGPAAASKLLRPPTMRSAVGTVAILMALAWGIGLAESSAETGAPSTKGFRAGVATVDITPMNRTSRIAGGFLEAQSAEIHDPLFVRAFVLDDGRTQLALVVVDTCMMTQQLIDSAKQLASQQTTIPVERMMVSATHTHSAPAAMGCLGTREDTEYAQRLPAQIAAAIVAAQQQLTPARIGWSSMDDWAHTHNRRWIRHPDQQVVDPFGEATGRAHMHPGHLSPHVIGPSGPVDPGLSVIALQKLDGKPLGVLANYSQHYFGAPAVSADYYGLFAKYVAELLGEPGSGNGPFVCAMSQGTSGDQMWMDYGSPPPSITLERYAESVAKSAQQALAQIKYHDTAELAVVEKRLRLKYRVPDEQRLAWARPLAAQIQDDLPRNIPEVYAREALILHERQATELKLQAIRIGDLTIATLPNEVYALTGLKLKTTAPLGMHFNIELANGAEGYIPTPEQHQLGGYTTWPARTAGLEVEAEPRIVETLQAALSEVSGRSIRSVRDEHGEYAQAVLESGPVSYFRLNEMAGKLALNAVRGAEPAQLLPGFAWYLPGVGSGTGIGAGESLVTGPFSGPRQINRSVHLAGGELETKLTDLGREFSVAVWFWLGEKSGASERQGELLRSPNGWAVVAQQTLDHRVRLRLAEQVTSESWPAEDWNLAALVSDGQELRLHVNGNVTPALRVPLNDLSKKPRADTDSVGSHVTFGRQLEGKLDEVAIWRRAITAREWTRLWELSGMPAQLAAQQAARELAAQEYVAQVQAPQFPAAYGELIRRLEPAVYWTGERPDEEAIVSGQVSFSPQTFATFLGGRCASRTVTLSDTYTVSAWIRCETPNDAQPVTSYFFSRGSDGVEGAAGDHWGIGGTYRPNFAGKLLAFNGNQRDQVVIGRQTLLTNSWNHVVLVREGRRVRAYLNGGKEPDLESELDVTASDQQPFYVGARSDQFAPHRGQIAQLAVFAKVLPAAEIQALFATAGVAHAGVPTDARSVGQSTPAATPRDQAQPTGSASVEKPQSPPPTSEPLSPDESLRKIHVPAGYRVELVAAEPLVLDPVAFDWDELGRLWVVEMADYPLGMDGQGKPGGRVRRLEDRDGDGRFEHSILFAEGLNFPNGILTWRDGVIISAAPEILWLRDSSGDGVCDEREVLLSGFHEGNQQLRVNGLRWGLDGWVYCANGGHHAGHGADTEVLSLRSGKKTKIGSRDFRFRPDTGELALESGPSQFGRNRDAWGHWFGTQNSAPLWQYVIPDRYLGRNPYVPAPSPIRHIVGPGSPKVYPASAQEKRYHSFEQSGRFTSACGGMIYSDDWLFGPSTDLHAFTCEPFHNLVQHNVLSDAGPSFTARRAAGEEQHDFFASEDRWCRPVMARTGPDGALWIADMYRYMIEHPEWLPAEGQQELLPHYRFGEDRGRIYRVVREGEAARSWPKLDSDNLQDWLVTFDSSNAWQRDKTQQLMLWRKSAEVVKHLPILLQSRHAEVRAQALTTLAELGACDDSFLIAALSDSHPRVREAAVRISEFRPRAEIVRAAARLAQDPDAKVRLQLALTCGEWNDSGAGVALAEIATRDFQDPLMVAAVMSSARPHLPTMLSALLRGDAQVLDVYREPLLRQALASGGQDADANALTLMLADALAGDRGRQFSKLSEFLLALERVGLTLAELEQQVKTSELSQAAQAAGAVIREAHSVAQSPAGELTTRLAAATLLTRVAEHREVGASVLAEALEPQVDPQLQQRALLRLSESGAANVPELLSGRWEELSPTLRSAALDTWMSRTTWTEDLLRRMEREEVARGSLDLAQQTRLKNHPVATIAELARRVFAGASNESTAELLGRLRPAIELSGQADAGRRLFGQHCATCHRRGERELVAVGAAVSGNVGPNLATVVGHPPEKLLTNIVDPNVDIQPGYQAYSLVLTTGEVLSGVLTSETANSITLTSANGSSRTIARSEIDELKNLGVSLMPEGLAARFAPQDMADLIAFLKSRVD